MIKIDNRVVRNVLEFHQARFESLLRRAVASAVTIEPDYVRPHSFIVRDALLPGVCQLVTEKRCTCLEFKGFGACPHHAVVMQHLQDHATRPFAPAA